MSAGMDITESASFPEREFRWHPLLGQWVIYAVTTSHRPMNGARVEQSTGADRLPHDPECYLCPGVTRSSGTVNPDYKGPFAFDNDYPSLHGGTGLVDDTPVDQLQGSPEILKHRAASGGACRVLCWNERHDLTLAELEPDAMLAVAKLWQTEYRSLSSLPQIAQVLVFENKGVEVGVSNLHPHGQIYAIPFVSDVAQRMRDCQARYAHQHKQSMLEALVAREEYSSSHENSLLIEEGQFFKTIVPWFARFAYETWIVPKVHVTSIAGLGEEALAELAALYQAQAKRYDILFQRSAPNMTLMYNAPCNAHDDNAWCCFHIAFQPPLREPDKLKFLAGFETAANNVVNPLTPEIAAHRLRECQLA